MLRTIAIYGLVLAAGALVLQWIEYRYITRVFSTEIYITLIALGFTALGAWVGARLIESAPPSSPDREAFEKDVFEKNAAALTSLGVTAREYEVLELLAAGQSNKEIARTLSVSPNTVKTHLARLYEKLEVSRRTQAVHKARQLALIP